MSSSDTETTHAQIASILSSWPDRDMWETYIDQRFGFADRRAEQPLRADFERAIFDFKKWVGQKIPADEPERHHVMRSYLMDLMPESAHVTLWIHQKMQNLKANHPAAFEAIRRKMTRTDFSHEAFEMLIAIEQMEVLNPVSIEIDPELDSGPADLMFETIAHGRVIIEISRLEESQERRLASREMNQLTDLLFDHGYRPALHFLRDAKGDEFPDLVSRVSQAVQKRKPLVERSSLILLVAWPFDLAQADWEGYKNECTKIGLDHDDIRGPTREERTPVKLLEKIRKKRVHEDILKHKYVLILYGLGALHLRERSETIAILEFLSSRVDFPVFFNSYHRNADQYLIDIQSAMKILELKIHQRFSILTFTGRKHLAGPYADIIGKLSECYPFAGKRKDISADPKPQYKS